MTAEGFGGDSGEQICVVCRRKLKQTPIPAMTLKALITPLAAVLTLAIPATGFADHNKIKVRRDLDGDGHYNTKTYKVPHHRHYSDHRYHYGSYGYGYGGYGYPRSYGYGYGYPRYYGYGYGYPRYYGYSDYYYPRTSLGLSLFSLFSRPTYYSSSRVYRPSKYYSSGLAVEVQTALKRRGYYRGPIDGDIGSGSRAAIRAYQRKHNLSETGRIDSALLRSLKIG
jgi:hypothetical protein